MDAGAGMGAVAAPAAAVSGGGVGVPGPTNDYLFKAIVIGQSGAGKTSIVRRYVENLFTPNYKHTVGVDFALKVLRWRDGSTIRMQLWDIAGQARFGAMTRVYYRDSNAAVVVFDLTDQASFEAIKHWKEDLDAKVRLPSGGPIPALLVGNKSDQPGRVVSSEQLEALANQMGFIGSFETSAKNNINVSEAFEFLVSQIMHRQALIPPVVRTSISLSGKQSASSTAGETTAPGTKRACCGSSS